ncbi:hypothetical protein [Bacillus dakarensis]|nr:hypothetical protein [Bacillus dakarensis]
MKKAKEDKSFQLSYESDGEMGKLNQDEEHPEKKVRDFFNTTQQSE